MIYTSENDWYYWSYGNAKFERKSDATQVLKTTFTECIKPVFSFKEELLNNAKSTIDHFDGKKFSILFSGGMDSELVLRSYLELKHDFDVNIFRYEKDYNVYDVSHAVVSCEKLGVPYKIIDFNLEKFYESEAESISEIAQIDRPRALPQLKFMDFVDNIPIIGASDCRWFRPSVDYNEPSEWWVQCFEHDIGYSKYVRATNRSAIAEWFKWTPGVVVSYTYLKWFKKLVTDQYIGKTGVTSTKYLGYNETYPDLIERIKKTGFEYTDHLVLEFEEHLKKKYNGLIYRQTDQRSMSDFYLEVNQPNCLTDVACRNI
jgi:ferredoxin-fold anticodon binding domain-containing protein